MSDIQQRIAEILQEHPMAEFSWGADPDCCDCGHNEKIDIDDPGYGRGWSNHCAEVLVSELGLTQEERWVPITESGGRWTPRSQHEAEAAQAAYPAGGSFTDGGMWDGVTRIDHESRFVTEWMPE